MKLCISEKAFHASGFIPTYLNSNISKNYQKTYKLIYYIIIVLKHVKYHTNYCQIKDLLKKRCINAK